MTIDRDLDNLALFAEGNADAFRPLYHAFANKLYRYLLGLLGSVASAEDALQDLFLSILEHPDRFQKVNQPEAYLLRCARNIALMKIRKRSELQGIENLAEQCIHPVSSQLEMVQAQERSRQVNRALFQLVVEQREVIQLHLHENLSFKTIGEICTCSTNTIASRYRRGLEKLKGLLHEHAE